MTNEQHPKYKWIFEISNDECPECIPYNTFRRKLRQQRERPKAVMGDAIYKYIRNYFADHIRRIHIKGLQS